MKKCEMKCQKKCANAIYIKNASAPKEADTKDAPAPKEDDTINAPAPKEADAATCVPPPALSNAHDYAEAGVKRE